MLQWKRNNVLRVFSTLSHKRHGFRGEKNIEDKMSLIFLYNFVEDISYSKKNSARKYYKCTQICMNRTRYSFQFLMKLEFSRQICKKSSYIKFRENPSNGSRVVHTKGHR